MSDSYLEREVHAEIARLARELHEHEHAKLTVDGLLLAVTRRAVDILPDVHHAGVTLVEGGGPPRFTAATEPIAGRLGELQAAHGEGPSLEVIAEHHTIKVKDYGSEARWPHFVKDLLEHSPVRSSLSVELYTEESALGVLTLYSQHTEAFTERLEDLALALGAHAAIALSDARRSDQFHHGLASRDIIGQAKGMIMERYHIGAAKAFGLLTRLSQEANTPLADVARRLVEREFPGERR